jgi:hypothetical protein
MKPASVSSAPTIAAIAARGRWRASQASCCSGSATAATEVKILDRPHRRFGGAAVRRPGERRAGVAIADPPRWVRIDLVAARHARELLAGEQDDVEDGGGEPDQAFDPPLHCQLAGCAIRHGARL